MPVSEYDDHATGGTPGMDKHERLLQQVELILDPEGASRVPGAVAIPAIPGLTDDGTPYDWRDPSVGLAYLARDGYILVRDADVARVRQALGGGEVAPRRGTYVRGLSLFWYDPGQLPDVIIDRSVDGICRFLDGVFGPGVATPDHLLFLVSTGTTCPATEPEPVYTPTRPYPQPCRSGNAGSGVVVWVLDSGLLADAELNAPWLAGVSGDIEDPYVQGTTDQILPYAGHGTFCAGVVRTMAPGAEVHVARTFIRKYLNEKPDGTFSTNAGVFESDLADMAAAAMEAGAQVLSLQFGAYSRGDLALLGISALKPLLEHHPGVALISAAGNDEKSDLFWPAAFDWVTGVGALSRNGDERAWFSNFGTWVDVYAPGEDLVNAYACGNFVCRESPNLHQPRTFHGMARWSGTCFATAMVAGLVACRMSQTGESAARASDRLVAEARTLRGVGAVVGPDSCPSCDRLRPCRGSACRTCTCGGC